MTLSHYKAPRGAAARNRGERVTLSHSRPPPRTILAQVQAQAVTEGASTVNNHEFVLLPIRIRAAAQSRQLMMMLTTESSG